MFDNNAEVFDKGNRCKADKKRKLTVRSVITGVSITRRAVTGKNLTTPIN